MPEANVDQPIEQTVPEATTVETTAPNPYEEQARAQGWTPKEEYTGDPAKWVDAAEFNRRGELFDKINIQNRQIKSLTASVQALKTHYDRVAEDSYQRALAEVQAQRTAAIKDGDVATALELGDIIDRQKEQYQHEKLQRQAALAVPEVIAPDFNAWIAANDWYDKDEALREEADIIGAGYKSKYPQKSAQEVLTHVTQKIKANNPSKFQQARVATVAGATPTRGAGNTQKTGKENLTAEETRVMQQLVRSGVLTEKQYLEDLSKLKARG